MSIIVDRDRVVFYLQAEHMDFDPGSRFISESLEDLRNEINKFITEYNKDTTDDESKLKHYNEINVGQCINIGESNEEYYVTVADIREIIYDNGKYEVLVTKWSDNRKK